MGDRGLSKSDEDDPKNELFELVHEKNVGFPNATVAGIDEAGRGCIAGPVVAATVILPENLSLNHFPWLSKIMDSKQLTAKMREELYQKILTWKGYIGIGFASVKEIDKMNILKASHLAMLRSLEEVSYPPNHVLVDGHLIPAGSPYPASPIVKGDQKALSIACASILAKVTRDHQLIELDKQYPEYGFAKHKGYGTQAHLAALSDHGVSPVHRRSFSPVASQMELAGILHKT